VIANAAAFISFDCRIEALSRPDLLSDWLCVFISFRIMHDLQLSGENNVGKYSSH
jgi:hypothetical protein